ncbi:MAG: ribosome maturation factor RimP [Methylibium sp.]|nr:ribosome maturation factor RimP [Methylibium sp.]
MPDTKRDRSVSLSSNWQAAVEKTVTGLGYEPVDCERATQGLLRVLIDRVPGQTYETGEGEFVTVDDCEKVTRQLQYVLEVEGCDYSRLEVSSPGLDRSLKKPADYTRFAGERIALTLKLAFQGRKRFEGVVQPHGEGWALHFNDGKEDQVLGFALDEVREARLVPVVDFKGRARQAQAPAGTAVQEQGDHEE